MLNNFVCSLVRATSNDPGLLSSLIVLDCDGIFTDIFEPDKFESAWSVTVYSFCLVFTDNSILKGRTRAEKEYSIGIASSVSVIAQ